MIFWGFGFRDGRRMLGDTGFMGFVLEGEGGMGGCLWILHVGWG